MVAVHKSSKSSIGYRVQLVFQLTQHLRDESLMKSFKEYLGCGNLCIDRKAVYLRVTKLTDIC